MTRRKNKSWIGARNKKERKVVAGFLREIADRWESGSAPVQGYTPFAITRFDMFTHTPSLCISVEIRPQADRTRRAGDDDA